MKTAPMNQIGRLQVHLKMRESFFDGQPVRIGSRDSEILELLIRRARSQDDHAGLLRDISPRSARNEDR